MPRLTCVLPTLNFKLFSYKHIHTHAIAIPVIAILIVIKGACNSMPSPLNINFEICPVCQNHQMYKNVLFFHFISNISEKRC